MFLLGKIHVFDELYSVTSYRDAGMSSMLVTQLYMKRVSSNRSTHKTRFCIDRFTELCGQRRAGAKAQH